MSEPGFVPIPQLFGTFGTCIRFLGDYSRAAIHPESQTRPLERGNILFKENRKRTRLPERLCFEPVSFNCSRLLRILTHDSRLDLLTEWVLRHFSFVILLSDNNLAQSPIDSFAARAERLRGIRR